MQSKKQTSKQSKQASKHCGPTQKSHVTSERTKKKKKGKNQAERQRKFPLLAETLESIDW